MSFKIADYNQYQQDYQRAVAQPAEFWAEIASHYQWKKPWDKVLEYDFSQARNGWFLGGKLNITENCLDRHLPLLADKTAIVWESNFPTEANRSYTYQQLHRKVCQAANALLQLGVKKGDRVCLYMPMVPELLISVLACARIGAVHSVVFGGFSPNALAERINDAQASLLITANIGYRGDKKIAILEAAQEALSKSNSIKRSLVWSRDGDKSYLAGGLYLDFEQLCEQQPEFCPATEMDAEDPLFILYTSGSTGKPKGVVHSCGGYMVYTGYTFANVFNCGSTDLFFCTADIGWVTGHSYICYAPLLNGVSVLMYEGIPTYPSPSRFWQLVDKHQVSHLYTAPTAIRALMLYGESPLEGYDLGSLKLLGSVGEPINEEAWHWYCEFVGKKRCEIVDTWWQTETGGILISGMAGISPMRPSWAGQPLVGVQLALMDEQGQEISEAVAEGALCIKFPFPSLLRTTYGDHERCRQTYFSTYPNHYFTGDKAKRDENGFYRILGRMDDVLNVSGHRIGTAELENTINEHWRVVESAVVGFPHDIKGEAIAAFIITNQPIEDKENILAEIQYIINKQIGAIAKLDKLFIVSGLPKTRSGKIMRRIMRKLLAGERELGDISTLLNPETVAEIQHLIEAH